MLPSSWNGSISHFPLLPLSPIPWGCIGFGKLDELCPRNLENFSYTYCFPCLSINIQVLPCLRNLQLFPLPTTLLLSYSRFSQDGSQTSCLSLSFSSLLLFSSIFFHNMYEYLKYAFVFFLFAFLSYWYLLFTAVSPVNWPNINSQ